MADITKCANGDQCPKCMSCYRWIAPNGYWQSYAPFYEADKECEYYYERECLLSNSEACKECA